MAVQLMDYGEDVFSSSCFKQCNNNVPYATQLSQQVKWQHLVSFKLYRQKNSARRSCTDTNFVEQTCSTTSANQISDTRHLWLVSSRGGGDWPFKTAHAN